MRIIFSLTIFSIIPLINFCSQEDQQVGLKDSFVIRTIDGKGKPVQSSILYEFLDCEYDFVSPSVVESDKKGISIINVPKGAYIQFYAKGFLHESYKCFNADTRPDFVTVYAASIPTLVVTKPHAVINYFVNSSGNCDFENFKGSTAMANAKGKAILYLPLQETYKIEVAAKVQCFQPDQEVHTLIFDIY